MEALLKNWKRLEVKDPAEMQEASNTLHHAALFIAMTGKYYIPEIADDSHTNAQWYPEKNWLVGNTVQTPTGKIRIALDYPLLVLIITDNDLKPIAEITFDGKTRMEVFEWLKEKLNTQGLDVAVFKPDLHYDIPDHPVMHGDVFKMRNPLLYMELAFYRTNGNLLLEHFTDLIKPGESVRVWPHHFDDGSYLPLQFDENGTPTGSINLGMAVADSYYPEPYFFVTAWKSEGVKYDNLPSIEKPGSWHQKDWTGQVLKASDIVAFERAKDQLAVSFNFLKQTIINAQSLIGENKTIEK
jgi:hypothetical protein